MACAVEGRTHCAEGTGLFDLVVTEVIAGDTGEDALLERIDQGVDLPVLGEQNPFGRLHLIEVAEIELGFDVVRARDLQAAQGIERNQPHTGHDQPRRYRHVGGAPS